MKNGKGPLVSIALATYNGEKYLRQQLDSLFNQTYRPIEVIASDDCSSDGTVRILEEHKKKFGLRYSVNKKNLGFVKNFEAAARLCKGGLIAFADQDDIWHKEKIEILVKEIGNFSLICTDAELIDGDGTLIAPSFQDFSKTYYETDDQFRFFVFRNYVTGCTSMVKKEVLARAIPIPDGIRYHDWWFALVAASMKGVRYLPQRLIQYRQHLANDTGASESITIRKKIREFLSKRKKGFYSVEIANCRGMLTYDGFNDRQKSVLCDRLTFYNDLQNSIVHVKSFSAAWRHRKYMLAGRSLPYKVLFLLASLLQ